MKNELTLDRSPAERRYVLVNTETEQLANDELLTSGIADQRNCRLADNGEPWRWVPFAETESAAA